MDETGEEKEQPNPSLWETLALTQEPQPQNNDGWNQSTVKWGQSLNSGANWKSDGCGTSSGQRKPDPPSWTWSRSRSPRRSRNRNVRSSRSPGGDLRQLIDRGANWREASLSPPHCGVNATRYREPCHDLRRGAWSNDKREVSRSARCLSPCSRREASQPDWGKRGEPSAWKQTDHPVSADSHLNEHNRDEKNLGNERSSHPLKADVSENQGTSPVCNDITQVENENQPGLLSSCIKLPDLNDGNRHKGWGPHSPLMIQPRSRSSSPFSHAAQEVNKSIIEKESDGWGLSSSRVDRSRSRSPSPWSQAAQNTKENSDRKDADGWGKDLDQTGLDAWNQTKSSLLFPNRGSNRLRGGCSASRSRDRSISVERKWKRTGWDSNRSPEHKWRKTGQHPDRSRCSERSFSPENRPRRTGWDRGRSRGRGSIALRSLSRFNRSEGISPTDNNKTKDRREKRSGFSSPQRNCSDVNRNMDDSRSRFISQWSQVAQESMKNANPKESDGWDQNSSPVKKSRSRSGSPWSQAAVDINKNYNNKETDGWGMALDQTGPNAWNQPRSNLPLDCGFKRRGGLEPRDQSRSPAPKWRRTRWDLDRSRGRDSSYSPDNKHRKSGWNRGVPRYRGRGRTNSPYRCQNRGERGDPSYSPISRSRRSPKLQRSPSCVLRMDQDREKRDGSEGRYDKKTNDADNATKVQSWEGTKWHDWSVNALRNSIKDPNLIFSWGHPANTGHGNDSGATHTTTLHPEELKSSTEWTAPGVAGNTMAIPEAYCKTKQRGVVMDETYSQDQHVFSQNSGDVKEKMVKNSPAIEHSMNGTTYLPLSFDPWDNDACIASSHATSALLVNPTASQSLSNHQNPILVSNLASKLFLSAPWSRSTNMLQKSFSSTWGPSKAPFKYPTLEPKTDIATASSFSNCGGTKSNMVPIAGSLPRMPMLNAPTMSNGIYSVATPSARLAHFIANLPPLTSTDGTNSSTPSAVPEARFSNTDVTMKLIPCTDTKVKTSCSGGTDSEPELSAVNSMGHTSVVPKVGLSQTNQDTVVAGSSKTNIDAVMQPISCTDTKVGDSLARGSDAESELSAVCPVDPASEVPGLGQSQPNQNPIVENGTTVGENADEFDNVSFKWALIGFAKPKLKPFWLNRYLTNTIYQDVIHKFVENVSRSLGTAAPQTNEDIHKFIKEQNDSLSKFLQKYLQRFVSENIIKNMRYVGRHEKTLVFQ